jgi:hypothetical protein
VMLGNGAFIRVGGAVYMLEGRVRSFNGVTSMNAQQMFNVTAPPVAMPPE